jgi:hypothetical protein
VDIDLAFIVEKAYRGGGQKTWERLFTMSIVHGLSREMQCGQILGIGQIMIIGRDLMAQLWRDGDKNGKRSLMGKRPRTKLE